MTDKPRVLVVGAGPAGLSAAVHLLEEAGGELSVELVSMGHHLGGKAASWRDAEGYVVDHGFHAVFGFYEEMKSLARRAGVDLSTALVSSRGRSRILDERTLEVSEVRLSRNGLVTLARLSRLPGLSRTDQRALADAGVRMERTIARVGNLEALDDVCYRTFLLEHGVPPGFLRHPAYRQVQELAFHGPHEVSTYIVLRASQLLGHCYYDATFDYVAGSLSELFWEPIARYVERLGGAVRVRQKLVALEHDGGRLAGARFAVPDNAGFHQNGQRPWPNEVPVAPGTEVEERNLAGLVLAAPVANLCELEPEGPLWSDPYFGNLRNLTSVSTLSLQLWLEERVPDPGFGSLLGLPSPLTYALDYVPLVRQFQREGRYRAALEWVGAEAGYEGASDEELVAKARADLARVKGFEGTDRAKVVHQVFRRNRANHQRYLLTDPGTLRFRPKSRTPIAGLYLAGDYCRTEVDIPTMEGAIRSGKAAAKALLEDL